MLAKNIERKSGIFMTKVESAMTEIKAASETIWGILTDASKYTEWDPSLISMAGTIAPQGKLTFA
jgi:hypothetical protein